MSARAPDVMIDETTVLTLFRIGFDTAAIASLLHLREAQVFKILRRARAKARSAPSITPDAR